MLVRWLRSLVAWRAVRSTGVWVYCENDVTGQRKAVQVHGGHQPLDRAFLRNGDRVIAARGSYTIGSPSELWHG
jgi:hypothetical protein